MTGWIVLWSGNALPAVANRLHRKIELFESKLKDFQGARKVTRACRVLGTYLMARGGVSRILPVRSRRTGEGALLGALSLTGRLPYSTSVSVASRAPPNP